MARPSKDPRSQALLIQEIDAATMVDEAIVQGRLELPRLQFLQP